MIALVILVWAILTMPAVYVLGKCNGWLQCSREESQPAFDGWQDAIDGWGETIEAAWPAPYDPTDDPGQPSIEGLS